MLEDLLLHEGEARGYFVGVHGSVHAVGHYAADDGIFIESTEELVVEVRVVRTHLVLHDQAALLQEFFL